MAPACSMQEHAEGTALSAAIVPPAAAGDLLSIPCLLVLPVPCSRHAEFLGKTGPCFCFQLWLLESPLDGKTRAACCKTEHDGEQRREGGREEGGRKGEKTLRRKMLALPTATFSQWRCVTSPGNVMCDCPGLWKKIK